MQGPSIKPKQLAIVGGVCCLSVAWMYLNIPGADAIKSKITSPPSAPSASSPVATPPPICTPNKAGNLAITSSFIFQSLIWLVLCLFSQPPGSLIPSLSTTPPSPISAGIRYSISKHVFGRLWRVSPLYDIIETIIIWTYRRRGRNLGKWKREKVAMLALYYLRIRGVGQMSQEVRRINRDRVLEWRRTANASLGDLMGLYGEPKWFSASDIFVMLKVGLVGLKVIYLKGWSPSVLLVKLLGAAYIASFVMVKLLELSAIIWVDDGEITHMAMEQEEDELRCWLSVLFTPAPKVEAPNVQEETWEGADSGIKTPTKEKTEEGELTPPPSPPTTTIPAPFEDFISSEIEAPQAPSEKKTDTGSATTTTPPPDAVYKKDLQGRRVYVLPTPDTLQDPPSQVFRATLQTALVIQNFAILPICAVGYWHLPQFSSISFFTATETLIITTLMTMLSSAIVHVVTEMLLSPVLEKGKHIQLAGLKNRIGWLPSLLSDVFLKGHVDYHTANVQYYFMWFVKVVGLLAIMSGGLKRAGVSLPEILAATWKVGKPAMAYPVINYAYSKNQYVGVIGANLVLLGFMAARFYEPGTCGVSGWAALGGYRERWTEWIV